MKIYKVYYEELSDDWGRFEGYATKGFYATEEKAKNVASTINRGIGVGDVYIEEIEVEE